MISLNNDCFQSGGGQYGTAQYQQYYAQQYAQYGYGQQARY